MTIVTCLLVFVVPVDLVVVKADVEAWVVEIVDDKTVVADGVPVLKVIEVSDVVDAEPGFALG